MAGGDPNLNGLDKDDLIKILAQALKRITQLEKEVIQLKKRVKDLE